MEGGRTLAFISLCSDFGDIVDFWQLQTRIRDLISSIQEEENNNERERMGEQKEAESRRRDRVFWDYYYFLSGFAALTAAALATGLQ